MSSETGNRIWRPSVEPTENPPPYPSPSGPQRLYTKTSLIASKDNQSASYNRAILSASQSYNNSPRPFRRQEQVCTSVNSLPSVSFSRHNNYTQQQKQLDQLRHQEQHQQQQSKEELNSLAAKKEIHETETSNKRAESMSPKLVHRQYNSPLDLYSMNNIRKTIEAHTELIAPGVKGINFMKSDTPVNKQSEVYRLVKEEEEQRTRQATSRLSPISGQPLKLPTGMSSNETIDSREQNRLTRQQQQQQQQSTASTESHWTERQRAMASSGSGRSNCPICCECGHTISGLFAKIQDRFVHPQCFNCTTCGTSLKNTGYFTIENKLYCEIHAKQVANMMRIPFNFAATQAQTSAATCVQESTNFVKSAQTRLDFSDNSTASAQRCQSEAPSAKPVCSRLGDTLGLPATFGAPATISTMFANRNLSQEHQVERGEQRYTRASSVNEMSEQKLAARFEANSNQPSSQKFRQFSGQQTMVSSNTTRDRRFIEESCQVAAGGRLPICVNCNAQIHGPYILAGQSTWCKHCSQSHFNCISCNRSLLDVGFIEDGPHKYYCEHCYEAYCAPICSKCNIKIKGDCVNGLNKKWHPSCFTCGHCRRPFGNTSFYLEDNVPYCERDWKALFTTKCYACSYAIEAGDKWIEALGRNYHSNCFRCTSCQTNLEGSTFYRKGDKPYCRLHAR